MRKCLGALGGAALIVLRCATAQAHIDLLSPEARAHGTAARGDTQIDENSNLKSGPCGQVASGRSSRVATYAPGELITVRVREENAHVSYLRVSIDLDGESFPLRSEVPAAPETQQEASAAEAALGGDGLLAVVREDNDVAGFVHEIEVTLPDATCDGCTLQVLQYMYDDPAAPYYFQCADLVIAAPSVSDAGAPAGEVASPDAGSPSAAVGQSPVAAGPGNVSAPAPSPPSAAGGTEPASPARVTGPASAATSSDPEGSSSCAQSRGGRTPASAVFALAVIALAAARRRRAL